MGFVALGDSAMAECAINNDKGLDFVAKNCNR